MNDENSDKTSDKLNAVANLAKAVPVYDDALKPIAQETGKALGTVGKAVNTCLAPIRGFVWGADQVEDWLVNRVSKRLENTPEDEIQTPDLAVAGPTIEALKFNGHKAELSEMFAGLLAGAMRKSTSEKAHPTFVNKISSMTALDARIFELIFSRIAMPTIHIGNQTVGQAGYSTIWGFYNPDFWEIANELGISYNSRASLVQASIENLNELGLIRAKDDGHLTAPANLERYVELEESEVVKGFKKADTEERKLITKRSYVTTSQTGKLFAEVVLSSS